MDITPNDVRAHLGGISYPATREALLAAAREDGASADVMEMLASIADREYADPDDVMNELGDVRI
jgi:hypothetical protein